MESKILHSRMTKLLNNEYNDFFKKLKKQTIHQITDLKSWIMKESSIEQYILE